MDEYPKTRKEWRDIHAAVLTYAMRRTLSVERASSATQEAFARMFEGIRPWHPERQPNLTVHVILIVKSLLSRDRKLEAKQAELENAWAESERVFTDGIEGSAEQKITARSEQLPADRKVQLLRARLKDLPFETRVLDLFDQNVTKADAQADELEAPVARVYEARKRIGRLCATIVKNDRPDPEEKAS